MTPLLFLELNEVNFSFVEAYIERGHLPNFKRFLEAHGFSETTSEDRYEDLEPWIQWVSAHTGLSLREHGVFRLGDIVNKDIEQIWERAARHGVKVGAISPMNAKCRGDGWDFFLPDPWTKTDMVASPTVRRFFEAVAQAVNDNAQQKLSARSLANLAIGSAYSAQPGNYLSYVNYVANIRKKPWLKAIFLDQLLADLFERSVASHKTQFATLFLNAAAHIQHHYMFSSGAYDGSMRNPSWYIEPGQDPLLDVYFAYDRILGRIERKFPHARLMVATGLHQDPYKTMTYYWRLKDHKTFLEKIGVEFRNVEPRMSRDFLIGFDDAESAARAQQILSSAKGYDGIPLFEVDNRGESLFVMLTYPNDINELPHYLVGNQSFDRLIDDVAFVAIKNGEHNGIGYFSDSYDEPAVGRETFPLTAIPDRVLAALGIVESGMASDKCAALGSRL